jgi:ribosomal protein S21
MSVQIIPGWDYEASLLIFKKAVDRDGVLRDLQVKRFAQTRTQRRKAKDEIADRRRRQQERRRLFSLEKKRYFSKNRNSSGSYVFH